MIYFLGLTLTMSVLCWCGLWHHHLIQIELDRAQGLNLNFYGKKLEKYDFSSQSRIWLKSTLLVKVVFDGNILAHSTLNVYYNSTFLESSS